MAEGDAPQTAKAEEHVVHTYPLVRQSDMSEEMQQEAIELIVTYCEKYANDNEAAAKVIKDQMDKKFGVPFHVVIGEGYGFQISYELKNLLYMFFGGNLAVLVWKC